MLLLCLLLSMEFITKDIFFGDIAFDKREEYDIVYLEGCVFTDIPGEPQLPVKSIHFVLPSGKRIKGVAVKSFDYKWLPGEYFIWPAQQPQILSSNKIPKFISPKSAI